MQVSPLPGPFGVAVTGIDLATDMSEATIRALIGLLHEHQIIALPGQRLSNADYVKFGHFWGQPLTYPFQPDRHADFPELIRIGNPTSTPMRYRDGAIHWHSDGTYEEVPASVTMLYAVEAPKVGSETLFASTVMAYDALPEATKRRIDGMTALHCLSGAPELPGEKISFFPEATARHGIHKHPLVARHPVTGRKALLPSGTAFGVKGLDGEEGRALIAELRAHITQPQFVTRYKVDAGAILLWDNYQTMHTATPVEYSDDDGKRRLLYRISTRGIPALCQPARSAN